MSGESFRWKDVSHGTSLEVPAELRERAVRMVLESKADYGSEYEAIRSIAGEAGDHVPGVAAQVGASGRGRWWRPAGQDQPGDR